MSLQEVVQKASTKKLELMTQESWRFGLRATFAGAFLTLGTAWGAVAGNAVEKLAPGLGAPVFAMLFGLGLFMIIILNADLATSNMMYMFYGAVAKFVPWSKAMLLTLVTTLFNLVGAILVSAVMGISAKMGHIDATHLVYTLSEGKVDKSPTQWLLEGILANVVVNVAVIGAVFAKELSSKFLVIVPIIGVFVGLGLEHVIANFSLFTLAIAGTHSMAAPLDAGHVIANWVVVWIGNFIGGGVIMGGGYAYLNKTKTVYKD